MKYRYAGLLLPLLMFGATCCSRMCITNTDKGVIAGALLGAGTGAIIAAASTVHTGPGMAFGTLGGAIIGAIVGGHIDGCEPKGDMDALIAERDALLAKLKACEDENANLRAEIARLNARIAELEAALAAKPGSTPGKELARYVIGNNILFASGKADLTDTGRSVLEGTAAEIRDKFPNSNVVIEGHTDSVAIGASGWKSNWELGAGRALAVLHYLQDNANMPGEQLAAETFSFYRPAASNETSEGKAQNRRTEIVVYAEK